MAGPELHHHERTRQWTPVFWVQVAVACAAFISGAVDTQAAGGYRAASGDPMFRSSLPTMAFVIASALLRATYMVRETRYLSKVAKAPGTGGCYPWLFAVDAALVSVGATAVGNGRFGLAFAAVVVQLMAYPLMQGALNDYWRTALAEQLAAAPAAGGAGTPA